MISVRLTVTLQQCRRWTTDLFHRLLVETRVLNPTRNFGPKWVETKSLHVAATNVSVVPGCDDRWVWSIGGMAIGWQKLKEVEINFLYFHFVNHKSTTITLRLHSDLCSEKIWGLNGSRAQEILPFSYMSRLAQRPTQPLIQWVTWFFPRVNQLGQKLITPPPSSAEFKNDWSYSSTSPLCL
jgi:hypothetical protein